MRKLTMWERGWLSGVVDADGGVYFNHAVKGVSDKHSGVDLKTQGL